MGSEGLGLKNSISNIATNFISIATYIPEHIVIKVAELLSSHNSTRGF